MATIENEIATGEQYANLFDFWVNIPVIKYYDKETYGKYFDQYPRRNILDILVTGIKEQHPISKIERVRRALSAKEIMDILNKDKTEEDDDYIKKSNLYFHLQKLEEINAIQVVEQIPTGKRFTTYYGRSAKIVTVDDKQQHDPGYNIFSDPEFKKILKIIDPRLNSDEIEKALNLSNRIYNHSYFDLLNKWLEIHEKEIRESDLDIRKLFDLIGIIYRYDEKTLEGLSELKRMLRLPSNED